MDTRVAPIVYIRLRKQLQLKKGSALTLGQAAQFIADKEYELALQELVLLRHQKQDGNIMLIDTMRIVRAVKKRFPHMGIEFFGEPHVLVEIIDSERRRAPIAFIVLIGLLLFFGSGLAIMNFHADVSMGQVHRRIYELITGKSTLHPYIMQIPYSIGIGAGMILFFNHLFKKKFNEEPSPLEVEMFLYQENLRQYEIAEEYEKMKNRGGDS